MSLFNSLLRWYLRGRIPALERMMRSPMAAQEPLFKSLIINAQDTEWGKKYDYASMRTIAQFQQRVPIQQYDDLRPYIMRMLSGEKNILWRGLVSNFSKSSGTTSDKSKYIPVSQENLHKGHLASGHDTLALWYDRNPTSNIFSGGKGLVMGGSSTVWRESPKIVVGDVSALLMQNMPFYIKFFQTPDRQTALLADWETKIEKMLEVVHKENVTNINGVPTWTLVLLHRLLEKTGKQNASELFPNFEVYMHGGVSFAPYRQQFKDLFPSPTVQYREIYNASEGFFAAQCERDDDSMLLYLNNGVFYEFMPLSELDKENPKTLTIEEVALNENYALIISTNAGLWRYMIGDTIRFTSLYPHKIQITGRTKHFINAFGEEVMIDNTDRALAQTCQTLDAQVVEYTAAPIYLNNIGKGGHEWLIEFSKQPLDLQQFAQLLDQNLQAINSDYEAKRHKDIALQNLVLHSVPQGTFHHWLKSKGKLGGQHKVPRLANHRQYVEEILKLV